MKRGDRLKASDVAELHPRFLGTPATFDQAFPTIADFDIEVEEDDGGWPIEHGKHRFTFANRSSLRPFINCTNRACYGGGLNIQQLLEFMVAAGETILSRQDRCQGYEGSPKGRKRYRDCMHGFKISVRLALADKKG